MRKVLRLALSGGALAATLTLLAAVAVAKEPPAENPYLTELLAQAGKKELARHPQWLRLLHVRRTWYGRRTSAVDGRSFFLAPRGKTHPDEELDATLAAFFDPPPHDSGVLHPQTRFPARYAWLKSQLDFDPARLPEIASPRFDDWRAKIGAASVTAVFAAAYLNNPASMYGHTFLRLGPAAPDREPLNDYSLNFAADTPERNGLLFALKGLLGAYPGRFTTTPYYFKIQQYTNMESRDLWEYTLALTPDQTDFLARHLWEMGPTHFDYYFLTENCSFQLLPLLEAADPSLDVSRRFRLKAIPTDTLLALTERPDFITHRRARPSQLRLVLARRALLTPKELRAAEAVAREKPDALTALAAFPPERQALVLDSAYDYFRYRHGFKRYQLMKDDEVERQLLLRRGALGVKSPDVTASAVRDMVPPESGHKSGRVAAGIGRGRGRTFEELSIRPALHDLADDPAGYVPGSRLEMFHLRLRRDEDSDRVYLERFGLLDMASLVPLDRWVKKPSWQVFVGLDSAPDLGRAPDKSVHAALSGATGPSVETRLWRGETFYAMAGGHVGMGGIFQDGYRLGAEASVGTVLTLAARCILHAEGGVARDFAGNPRTVTRLTVTPTVSLRKNLAARAVFRRTGVYRESLFTLNLYL